jgi:S1-C subfamily serine protease
VTWNGSRDVVKAMRSHPLRPGDAVKLRVRHAGGRDREVTLTARTRPDRDRLARRIMSDSGRTIVIQIPDGREFRLLGDSLAIRMDSLQKQLRIVLRDSLAPHLRALEEVQIPEIQLRARELAREMGPTGFVFGLSRAVAGAEFADMNAGLASYFGTDRGVLVVRVAPDTPAAKSGLQAGDVITRVGDRRIAGVQELRREVVRAQEHDRHGLPVELVRKGKRRSLELRW